MDLDKERFYRARILQRRKLTDDPRSIRVERDSDFRFVAGQYATLGVLAPHKHIERPYSIVSSPHEPDLEFFLELVPRGELTPALHALQVGDEITIRKAAKGRFTLAPGRRDASKSSAPRHGYRKRPPSSATSARLRPRAGKANFPTAAGSSFSKAPATPRSLGISTSSSASPPKFPGRSTFPPSQPSLGRSGLGRGSGARRRPHSRIRADLGS